MILNVLQAVSLPAQRPLAVCTAAFFLLAAGAALAAPPVASNVSISGNLEVGQTLSGQYVYSDIDGDLEEDSEFRWLRVEYVSFLNSCSAVFGDVDTVSTNQQYTLTAGDEGDCMVFEVTPVSEDAVDDQEEGAAVQSAMSARVAPAPNVPPQITGQDSLDTDEDESLTLRVNDFDIDDPDDNNFTLTVQSGSNYTVNDNTITPAQNFNGELTVPVQVSDGDASSNVFNASVTVNAVNDAPQITGQDALSTNEDTPLTLSVDDFNITDPDDNSFSLQVQDGNNYSRSGNTITPDPGYSGTLTVPVYVNDGDTDSNTFNASVTVNDVNDPPVITGQDPLSTNENQPLTLTVGNFDIEDPDDNSFTLNVLSGSNYSVNGTTITPAQGFNGTLTVPVQVSDGAATSNTFNASVSVNPVNDAPVITGQDALSTDEDTALSLSVADFDIEDPDDDSFTLSVLNGSNYNVSGTTITPAQDYFGNLTVPVRVNDGDTDSNTFNASVTVNPVNDPPRITGQDRLRTDEDQPLTLSVNDFDIEDPDDNSFTLIVQGGENYSVNGTTITPDEGFFGDLTVPVRVNDGEDQSPVRNTRITVDEVNDPPVINAQVGDLETDEDTSLTLTVDDFDIEDPDTDLDEISIVVQPGTNYSHNGDTITPDPDFFGTLTVSVVADDGGEGSAPFDATVVVNPVNDAPVIVGQNPDPITTPEDTSVTITVDSLQIEDPDNVPADFTLTLEAGDNYTVAGNVVTPDADFDATLLVPATVTDGELTSAPFELVIEVAPENDGPMLVEPIPDSTAIENSPFALDVSGNFTDVEGDPLTFEASGHPAVFDFDGETGVLTGTLSIEDIDSLDPVYTVTVRALDPSGASTSDQFDLTLSALDRANLALDISVSPETGEPGDEFLWTFTSSNPVGPQPGATVELSGTFTGAGITTTPAAGAACTISQGANETSSFTCTVGAVPVGETAAVQLRTTVSQVTEVYVTATSASANSLPIDPNLEDNTESLAIGVGDAFSLGAAEAVGSSDVLAVAAGDINADGRADIVVGTAAGQPVQVFLADEPRASCNCYRDYVADPISLAANGESNGVALADFDNNGTLDIAVATGGGQADAVYSNDGTGNFTLMASLDAVATFGNAIASGDFDNDGNADIVIAAQGGNPVYLGDGAGGFVFELTLGDSDSFDVAVADFDGDDLDDVVFANAGDSRSWQRQAGGGFGNDTLLAMGVATSVAAGDLNGDGQPDIVLGRASAPDGVPSNPVHYNDGNGGFGNAALVLGLAPTDDIAIGDLDMDGSADLFFVNQSGVHQTWLRSGNSFSLAPEQIIDLGAVAVAIGSFGETAETEPGGNDIVLAGAPGTGIGIYLNDGAGNLGRGDVVPPELTLEGESTMSIPAGGSLADPGATAMDNIDGDISDAIVTNSTVNSAIVGTYSVTYNVVDFAGNAAESVTRTVIVEPAAGTGGGGGGGGSWSLTFLAILASVLAWVWLSADNTRQFAHDRTRSRDTR